GNLQRHDRIEWLTLRRDCSVVSVTRSVLSRRRLVVRRRYVEQRTAAFGDPQAISFRVDAPVLPLDATRFPELLEEPYAAPGEKGSARLHASLVRFALDLCGGRERCRAGQRENE